MRAYFWHRVHVHGVAVERELEMTQQTHTLHVKQQGSPTVHFARHEREGVQTPCGYFADRGKFTQVQQELVTCPRCLEHNKDETIGAI